jgi:hypothetical protein
VARHFISSFGVLLAIVLVSLACGAPVDTSSGSPAAQATNVRRTAVAEVQAIIANKSTPTPSPVPTATAMPTCQDALWWTDARQHVGESRTIQGTVVATRPAQNGSSLVELGQAYPDPTGLVVVVSEGDATALKDRDVCVAGRISLSEGRPSLQVRDPSAFTVVD